MAYPSEKCVVFNGNVLLAKMLHWYGCERILRDKINTSDVLFKGLGSGVLTARGISDVFFLLKAPFY